MGLCASSDDDAAASEKMLGGISNRREEDAQGAEEMSRRALAFGARVLFMHEADVTKFHDSEANRGEAARRCFSCVWNAACSPWACGRLGGVRPLPT